MTTLPADSVAATLAGFTAELRPDRIPPEVSLRARHLMLDAIGCAFVARQEPFAAQFGAALGELADAPSAGAGGSSGSGVIGHAARLPLRDAVMLNGILMHGLDYDDTHTAGVVHLTVSVLPAVLGLAAQRGLSGRDMLAAYVAAVEAGARIASAVKGGFHRQGLHPTGIVGTFASALAAGRLMGLDRERLVHAQGAALSLTAGSLQFIEDGAWTKRVHPGWAAQAGITAATFAAHGIVAPQAPYTGRYGLYRSFLRTEDTDEVDLAIAVAGLDADGGISAWELPRIAIKPFAMCHFVHAATDAAIALHGQGVDIGGIERVEVLVPEAAVELVCEPAARKRLPRNEYDAKFSLPYAVASGLMRGRLGLRELLPEAYLDPLAQSLMERVDYRVDPASTFPRHYSGEVRVSLRGGRGELRWREAINRGHADRPLSNEEIQKKYMENTSLHFDRTYATQVLDQVLDLDVLENVADLERLLGQDPHG